VFILKGIMMFKRLRLNSAKSRLVEERLYEMVMDELETGNIRKGIWAKAVAKSNGNDNQAKSKYLELRVESLKDEAHVIQSILDSKDNNPDLIEEEKSEVVTNEIETSYVGTSYVENETYTHPFFFVSLSIYSLALIIIVNLNSRELVWFQWLYLILFVFWLSKVSATRVKGEHLYFFNRMTFFVALGISLSIILFLGYIFSWQGWLCALLLSYFCATTRYGRSFYN
jgi:hypothetical protein